MIDAAGSRVPDSSTIWPGATWNGDSPWVPRAASVMNTNTRVSGDVPTQNPSSETTDSTGARPDTAPLASAASAAGSPATARTSCPLAVSAAPPPPATMVGVTGPPAAAGAGATLTVLVVAEP